MLQRDQDEGKKEPFVFSSVQADSGRGRGRPRHGVATNRWVEMSQLDGMEKYNQVPQRKGAVAAGGMGLRKACFW